MNLQEMALRNTLDQMAVFWGKKTIEFRVLGQYPCKYGCRWSTFPDLQARSPCVNLCKTKQKDVMRKKIFTVLILAGFGLFFSADLLAQTPWLSKDVQKIANKKELEKDKISNSNIQAVSTDQSWVLSKGISSVGSTEKQSAGNIRSTEFPQVAISKGVHQNRTKKELKEEQEDYQVRPAITGSN